MLRPLFCFFVIVRDGDTLSCKRAAVLYGRKVMPEREKIALFVLSEAFACAEKLALGVNPTALCFGGVQHLVVDL